MQIYDPEELIYSKQTTWQHDAHDGLKKGSAWTENKWTAKLENDLTGHLKGREGSSSDRC